MPEMQQDWRMDAMQVCRGSEMGSGRTCDQTRTETVESFEKGMMGKFQDVWPIRGLWSQ